MGRMALHLSDHSHVDCRYAMTNRYIYDLYLLPSWYARRDRKLLHQVTDTFHHHHGRIPCLLCSLYCGPGYHRPAYFTIIQGGDPVSTTVGIVCEVCELSHEFTELEDRVYMIVKRDLLPDAAQIHFLPGHA